MAKASKAVYTPWNEILIKFTERCFNAKIIPNDMATSYHLLYSQFVTAFSTPKFQVLNKTEVDIKSWIFPD